jgi:hypothetical protein
MEIAIQIIWRRKLEEYHDGNPNFRYFAKQYGQIIPLDVSFFSNSKVCMQPTKVVVHI